jgi:alpha-galactosidase
LERLDERQLSFVREGIEYYKSITEAKKNGLPKFPLGFGRFSKDFLCAGFETEDKLYLAVWNMGDDLHREIPLNGYKSAKCAYPSWNKLPFTYQNNKLTIEFTQKYQARFFEIER